MSNDLKNIIAPYLVIKGGLIPAIHAVQEHIGFISKENISQLAESFNYSKAEIVDVITYYDDFRLKPEGKNIIKICQAEACQSLNCSKLLDDITSYFDLNLDETSTDLNITLKEVFCLGNCALGPSVMINDMVIGEATIEKIAKYLKNSESKKL